MPHQALETIYLLTSVISVCFAFCIPVMAMLLKNAERISRLFAYSFFIVLILNLVSVLSHSNEATAVLAACADVLFLLALITVILSRASMLALLFIIAAPVVILAVLYSYADTVNLLYQHDIIPALVIFLSVAVMYLLKTKKGSESLVFWSVLPLAGSALANLYPHIWAAVLAVPLLKLISYSILLYYFYKVFFKDLIAKCEANAKKLSEIDRSIDLEVKKRMLEVERVNRKLVDIAKTDSLSNVLNKAAILEAIDRLIAEKPKKALSILMLDIDKFKYINDTFGHVVGDKCIRMLASSARNNFRNIDLIGRYGGDEFIVVLPETDSRQAVTIAERFRKIIEETSSPSITISIGISTYPDDGRDVKSLIMEADKSLYISKKKGRNAVSHRDAY